jgi:hypothetical protein
MELKPTIGIDLLKFGMKPKDVEKIYGKPSKNFHDEDNNIIWVYENQKLRLTFYEEEDNKLGYITSASEELVFQKQNLIQQPIKKVLGYFKNIPKWETETQDILTQYFHEDTWLFIHEEFGTVIKVEIGAIIKDLDTFDWKF